MSLAIVTVNLEIEAESEVLVYAIDRLELSIRDHFRKTVIHKCSIGSKNTFAPQSDASESGPLLALPTEEHGALDQIPHRPELNAPGNIGCICLACVKARHWKPYGETFKGDKS